MASPSVCPNPDCPKVFPSSRAAFVRLGNSKKCKAWDRQSRSQPLVAVDDSDSDEGFDDEPIHLPWRNFIPLPKWAQPAHLSDFQMPTVSATDPLDPDTDVGPQPSADVTAPKAATSKADKPPFVRYDHPTAGSSHGEGKTVLDEIRSDAAGTERENNMYHPFRDSDDFEMGAWLIQSGIPMAEIDNFLRLPWVVRFCCLLPGLNSLVFNRLRSTGISRSSPPKTFIRRSLLCPNRLPGRSG